MPQIEKHYPDKRHLLLPVYPVKFGINYKPRASILPLGAEYHQICYIENGECCITVNNEKQRYLKGTTFYVSKGLPISYEPASPDLRIRFVAFNGDFADKLTEFYSTDNFKYHKCNEISELIFKIYELAKAQANDDAISKHIYELIVTFFSYSSESSLPLVLREAMSFIEKNYSRDISVQEIAMAVGVSASFLSKLFRNYHNATTVEYLREIRLDHACQRLLLDPDESINSVARKCGFLDTAYFCKVFKNEYGVTPKGFAEFHSFNNTLNKVSGNDTSDSSSRTLINENFSTKPVIVDHFSDVTSSAWVRNNGILEDRVKNNDEYFYSTNDIVWNDGCLTFCKRSHPTHYFFYVSDLVLSPGKYSLSVDLKTPVKGEITAIRIAVYGHGSTGILYNPGTTKTVQARNNWMTYPIEFSTDHATSFYIGFFGGPHISYTHDFCVKNVILEKII